MLLVYDHHYRPSAPPLPPGVSSELPLALMHKICVFFFLLVDNHGIRNVTFDGTVPVAKRCGRPTVAQRGQPNDG